MKFEGPPQFDSEQPILEIDKPEEKIELEQKEVLERSDHAFETSPIPIEKPSEKIELRKEQEPAHKEIEKHEEKYRNSDLNPDINKKQPHESAIEKEKAPQQIIVNRQEIKKVGKQLRELLRGDISIENLSSFAKQLGIEHTIKTPLLRIAGANGLTQELNDGSAVILYHGILPSDRRHYYRKEGIAIQP